MLRSNVLKRGSRCYKANTDSPPVIQKYFLPFLIIKLFTDNSTKQIDTPEVCSGSVTDRQTDGQTDGRTDRQTDGQTYNSPP